MPKLPRISGVDAVKAFAMGGWVVARQKGSHVHLVKEGEPAIISVPLHPELDRGTLRALIRKSGMSVEEFNRLL